MVCAIHLAGMGLDGELEVRKIRLGRGRSHRQHVKLAPLGMSVRPRARVLARALRARVRVRARVCASQY